MTTQDTKELEQPVQNPATTDIPDDNAIAAPVGDGAWRFAAGKIVRGAEDPPRSGNYAQTREKIVGRLERVGVFHGKGRHGGLDYEQVEADVLTSKGLVHIKSSLTNMDTGLIAPSVSTVKFAWGLTQLAKGELFLITTSLGEPVDLGNGRNGGCPTYVNFARIDEKKQAHTIYSPRQTPGTVRKTLIEQWDELEPQVRAHPAYADREARTEDMGGDGPTHFSELSKECEQKGWPTPIEAQTEWLQLIAAATKTAPKKAFADYDDDVFGQIRQAIGSLTAIPPLLEPAKAKAATAAPAAPAVDASAFGAAPDPFV